MQAGHAAPFLHILLEAPQTSPGFHALQIIA